MPDPDESELLKSSINIKKNRTMKNYLKQYQSINLATLPDDISVEFKGIYENTQGFTENVELEAQNFEDLFGLVKEAFPDAIQKKLTGKGKKISDKAAKLKSAKSKVDRVATAKQKSKKRKAKLVKAEPVAKVIKEKVNAVKKIVVSAINKVTKSDSADKYRAKLADLKEQYKVWMSKVTGQEENLEKVLKLVRPDVKANGLGMTKAQAQIKRLEADISILKKVFKRNVKMEKAIMEKAQKALDPMSVKSLAKAIQKAQKLYEKEQSMKE